MEPELTGSETLKFTRWETLVSDIWEFELVVDTLEFSVPPELKLTIVFKDKVFFYEFSFNKALAHSFYVENLMPAKLRKALLFNKTLGRTFTIENSDFEKEMTSEGLIDIYRNGVQSKRFYAVYYMSTCDCNLEVISTNAPTITRYTHEEYARKSDKEGRSTNTNAGLWANIKSTFWVVKSELQKIFD